MYEIRFSPQAEKYFKKIKEKALKKAFQEALLAISEDPYQGNEKKGDLAGFYGWDINYARVNYEIAYRIYEMNNSLVVVVLAGTRENFYSELKRYIK
ncbi:MAG: type II toxin-antitoxin system RelE/ParE family toxin [Oscillospiraceae bacterium]|jgi:mRNA interferase RelE/StbE|nr:type II toxin-antitoxin system RelE/ParE family toxin [Oscillospiraceae bacterium]